MQSSHADMMKKYRRSIAFINKKKPKPSKRIIKNQKAYQFP